MSEPYSEIEYRIQEALDAIPERDRPNIVAATRKFRANSILRQSHTNTTTPPDIINENWARRFLNRHSENYVRKQKTIDIARKNRGIRMISLGGSRGNVQSRFAMRMASNAEVGTTSITQASGLELGKINRLSHETILDSRALQAQVIMSWQRCASRLVAMVRFQLP